MDHADLSRILSLIIGVLTDPYDKFVDRLHREGRVTDEEVQNLRKALNDQIPQVAKLVRPTGEDHSA